MRVYDVPSVASYLQRYADELEGWRAQRRTAAEASTSTD
jgi:hypothetical protein